MLHATCFIRTLHSALSLKNLNFRKLLETKYFLRWGVTCQLQERLVLAESVYPKLYPDRKALLWESIS